MDRVNLTVTTAATTRPLTVTELKQELSISSTAWDLKLLTVIDEAVEEFTNGCGIVPCTTTFTQGHLLLPLYFGHPLILYRAPVIAVDSISYVDTDGNSQTWDSSNYQVETQSHPGRVWLAYDGTLPTLRTGIPNTFTVQFQAGYGGGDDVPAGIKEFVYVFARARFPERRSLLPEEHRRLQAIISSFQYGP